MNVREIIKEWLTTHGYDGLAGDECGCTLDDLIPGSGECEVENCKPGRLQTTCRGCPQIAQDAEDCERACSFRDDGPKRCVVVK